MDIFLDDRNRLPHSVESELESLRSAGYAIEFTTDNDLVVEIVIRKDGEETRVQWFDDADTCWRFFPAQDDPEFGYRLHDADLAVNKVLCAARRNSAARDAIDLVSIVEFYAPLGPLVWAVSSKAPDMAPPSTLRAIRANTFGYAEEEVETVRMEDGSRMEWRRLRQVLDHALEAASDYCARIAPVEHPGRLFVDAGERPVEADDAKITNGKAIAMTIRNFSGIPVIGKGS